MLYPFQGRSVNVGTMYYGLYLWSVLLHEIFLQCKRAYRQLIEYGNISIALKLLWSICSISHNNDVLHHQEGAAEWKYTHMLNAASLGEYREVYVLFIPSCCFWLIWPDPPSWKCLLSNFVHLSALCLCFHNSAASTLPYNPSTKLHLLF